MTIHSPGIQSRCRIPPLTSRGNYRPDKLLDYLDNCSSRGIPAHVMASELHVSQDRIFWFLGPGRIYLTQRAEQL